MLPARLPARNLCAPVPCATPPRSEHGVRAPPHPPLDASVAAAPCPLIEEFSTASMHHTRFEDLWLRVGGGVANLYCHQAGFPSP